MITSEQTSQPTLLNPRRGRLTTFILWHSLMTKVYGFFWSRFQKTSPLRATHASNANSGNLSETLLHFMVTLWIMVVHIEFWYILVTHCLFFYEFRTTLNFRQLSKCSNISVDKSPNADEEFSHVSFATWIIPTVKWRIKEETRSAMFEALHHGPKNSTPLGHFKFCMRIPVRPLL